MRRKTTMASVTRDGTHLEQLQNLALVLAAEIDSGDGTHSVAQLARQYRETLDEIEALRAMDDEGDDLGGVLG